MLSDASMAAEQIPFLLCIRAPGAARVSTRAHNMMGKQAELAIANKRFSFAATPLSLCQAFQQHKNDVM